MADQRDAGPYLAAGEAVGYRQGILLGGLGLGDEGIDEGLGSLNAAGEVLLVCPLDKDDKLGVSAKVRGNDNLLVAPDPDREVTVTLADQSGLSDLPDRFFRGNFQRINTATLLRGLGLGFLEMLRERPFILGAGDRRDARLPQEGSIASLLGDDDHRAETLAIFLLGRRFSGDQLLAVVGIQHEITLAETDMLTQHGLHISRGPFRRRDNRDLATLKAERCFGGPDLQRDNLYLGLLS